MSLLPSDWTCSWVPSDALGSGPGSSSWSSSTVRMPCTKGAWGAFELADIFVVLCPSDSSDEPKNFWFFMGAQEAPVARGADPSWVAVGLDAMAGG